MRTRWHRMVICVKWHELAWFMFDSGLEHHDWSRVYENFISLRNNVMRLWKFTWLPLCVPLSYLVIMILWNCHRYQWKKKKDYFDISGRDSNASDMSGPHLRSGEFGRIETIWDPFYPNKRLYLTSFKHTQWGVSLSISAKRDSAESSGANKPRKVPGVNSCVCSPLRMGKHRRGP